MAAETVAWTVFWMDGSKVAAMVQLMETGEVA
jgi:hypothetical protein